MRGVGFGVRGKGSKMRAPHTVHTASRCACTAHPQPRTLRNIATRFAATLRHAASSCFTLCHDMLCQATSRRHVSGRLRRRLPYGRRQVDMVREGRGRQSQHQQSVFPFEGSTIAASVRSIYVHLQCGCSRASVAHVVSGRRGCRSSSSYPRRRSWPWPCARPHKKCYI